MKVILTVDQLEERCREWQKRLCLRDWVITITFADQKAMEDKSGDIHINELYKMAHIQVVSPETYGCAVAPEQDMELVIVHELLHLHSHRFFPEDGSVVFADAEFGINAIAGALVGLAREGNLNESEA